MAVFDTIMMPPKDREGRAKMVRWTENKAAIGLREPFSTRGFKVQEDVLRVEVMGVKGPLTNRAEEASRV